MVEKLRSTEEIIEKYLDIKTGEYWHWDCDKQMNVRASFVKDGMQEP